MDPLYLYPSNQTSFITNGDPIHDVYDAHVIRENGYYLKFKVKIRPNGIYRKLKEEMIVSAVVNQSGNRDQFYIYEIIRRPNYIEVTALQLKYYLRHRLVRNVTAQDISGEQIITIYKNNFVGDIQPFTFISDIGEKHSFTTREREDDKTEHHNALEILEKIANRWGADFITQGYNIRMSKFVGRNTEALLYERKNISDFEDPTSIDELITRIYAKSKWTLQQDDEGYVENGDNDREISVVVDSPLINQYARVYEASYTNNDIRTEAELRRWAGYFYSHDNVDKPTRSIKVETNIVDGTSIEYGDFLVLKYSVHNIDMRIQCVGVDFNPLSRTYYSVTLGNVGKTFSTSVNTRLSDVSKTQRAIQNETIKKVDMLVQNAADGQHRIVHGPRPMNNPNDGDLWYYYELNNPNNIEARIWNAELGMWVKDDFDKARFEERMAELEVESEKLTQGIAEQEINIRKILEDVGRSYDLSIDAKKVADEVKISVDGVGSEMLGLKNALYSHGTSLNDIRSQYNSIEEWKQATDPRLNQIVSNAQILLNQVNTLDGRLDTVEPVLDELGRQIGTKLTQADLSGYVTSTQLTATAGELTQEISRVQGLIPTEIGTENIIPFKAINPIYNVQSTQDFTISAWAEVFLPTEEVKARFKAGETYTIRYEAELVKRATPPTLYEFKVGFMFYSPSDATFRINLFTPSVQNIGDKTEFVRTFVMPNMPDNIRLLVYTNRYTTNGANPIGWDKVRFTNFKISEGGVVTPWSPHPDDYPSYAVVNEIKQTADSNSATIRDTQGNLTNLTQTVDSIKSSVEQTILDPSTGKIAQLQTQITQQAGEISQRLTRTEVESTITNKGYQTKLQVDSNITSRGYITNAALTPYATTVSVENKVRETADGINRTITEVRGLIPTQIGGTNLLVGTSSDWKTVRVNQSTGLIKGYNPQEWALLGIKTGDSVTFSVDVKTTSGKKLRSRISFYGANENYFSETFVENGEGRLSVTGVVPDGITSVQLFLDANLTAKTHTGVTYESYRREKLEIGVIPTGWSPAPEDLTLPFESFKNEYDRTAKSVIDNLSSVIQTDSQWYTTINNRLRTAEGNFDTLSRTTMPNLIDEKIAADNQIKDTRNNNQSPQWYWTNYPKQTVEELKVSSVIGVSGSTFAKLTTEVLWNDYSAGKVKQTAKTDTGVFERQGTGTTWDAWVKTANATDLNQYTPLTTFQTVQTTTELYERILGKTQGDIQTNASRLVMTDSLFQTEVSRLDNQSAILGRLGDGIRLTDDYEFQNGLNGILVYGDGGSGTIRIDREVNVVGSTQSNGKNTRLKITHTSTNTRPDWGGVARLIMSRANAEFVVKFNALLPTGREFHHANNLIGTGGTITWLTDKKGTGTFQDYMYHVKCGPNGTFQTFGHLYVRTGPPPSTTNPLVWYLSNFDVIDITQSSAHVLRSSITQLSDSISLGLFNEKGLVSGIQFGKAGSTIKANLLRLDATTVMNDAFAKKLLTEVTETTTLRAFAANINKLDVIEVNAAKITGDLGRFLRLLLDGTHSNAKLDGRDLTITRNDGSYATRFTDNGIELYRDGNIIGSLISLDAIETYGFYNNRRSISLTARKDNYIGFSYYSEQDNTYYRAFALGGDGRIRFHSPLYAGVSNHGIRLAQTSISGLAATSIRDTLSNGGILITSDQDVHLSIKNGSFLSVTLMWDFITNLRGRVASLESRQTNYTPPTTSPTPTTPPTNTAIQVGDLVKIKSGVTHYWDQDDRVHEIPTNQYGRNYRTLTYNVDYIERSWNKVAPYRLRYEGVLIAWAKADILVKV